MLCTSLLSFYSVFYHAGAQRESVLDRAFIHSAPLGNSKQLSPDKWNWHCLHLGFFKVKIYQSIKKLQKNILRRLWWNWNFSDFICENVIWNKYLENIKILKQFWRALPILCHLMFPPNLWRNYENLHFINGDPRVCEVK